MDPPVLISRHLQDFIHDIIEFGAALEQKSHPIMPVVAVWRNGEVEMNVMYDASGVGSRRICEEFIEELDAAVGMYAIIRDCRVRSGGKDRHVLIVDAEERGMSACVQFTQDFVPRGFLRGFRLVGAPAQSGTGPKRFR